MSWLTSIRKILIKLLKVKIKSWGKNEIIKTWNIRTTSQINRNNQTNRDSQINEYHHGIKDRIFSVEHRSMRT